MKNLASYRISPFSLIGKSLWNRSELIVKWHAETTCLLIEVAGPAEKRKNNIPLKIVEKRSKCKDFEIEISRMWHLKMTLPTAIGALGMISKGVKDYGSNSWQNMRITRNHTQVCFSYFRHSVHKYIVFVFSLVAWHIIWLHLIQKLVVFVKYLVAVCIAQINGKTIIIQFSLLKICCLLKSLVEKMMQFLPDNSKSK